MKALLGPALVLLALAGPAAAQTGNPANTKPTRDPAVKPAPEDMNPQDRLFIQQIALGGMGEVEMAQLAEQRGTAGDIKTFARRMIDDHVKANDRLAQLARDLSVALPPKPDAGRQAIEKTLSAAKGHAFDRGYLTVQMREHQKTVQLLEWIIGSGQNQAVRDYAIDTLPVVMAHLAMVRSLDEKLR